MKMVDENYLNNRQKEGISNNNFNQNNFGMNNQNFSNGNNSYNQNNSNINYPDRSSSVSNVKEAPGGIKFLAILGYISVVFCGSLGISFIKDAGILYFTYFSIFANSLGFLAKLGSFAFIIFGIFNIGIAIFYYFLARDLWRGKKWARIGLGILTGIFTVLFLVSIVQSFSIGSLIILIFNVWILYYLFLDEKVKEFYA